MTILAKLTKFMRDCEILIFCVAKDFRMDWETIYDWVVRLLALALIIAGVWYVLNT